MTYTIKPYSRTRFVAIMSDGTRIFGATIDYVISEAREYVKNGGAN